jgi:hypothetical protein
MREPARHLLISAFLRAKVREAKQSATYAELELEWGASKQVLLNLLGDGTIGYDVAWRIAERRYGGSQDAMLRAARAWWGKLESAERHDVERWCAKTDARRQAVRRVTPEDQAEIERIESGTRPSKPLEVVASEPSSGSFRHRR